MKKFHKLLFAGIALLIAVITAIAINAGEQRAELTFDGAKLVMAG